ncbi:MAG: hypothetical protein LBI81_02195 [Puniceicoccales bacterium]|jgi:hypothetical protein|nr:hypothetical protein [Puniceicoccales bacterium]
MSETKSYVDNKQLINSGLPGPAKNKYGKSVENGNKRLGLWQRFKNSIVNFFKNLTSRNAEKTNALAKDAKKTDAPAKKTKKKNKGFLEKTVSPKNKTMGDLLPEINNEFDFAKFNAKKAEKISKFENLLKNQDGEKKIREQYADALYRTSRGIDKGGEAIRTNLSKINEWNEKYFKEIGMFDKSKDVNIFTFRSANDTSPNPDYFQLSTPMDYERTSLTLIINGREYTYPTSNHSTKEILDALNGYAKQLFLDNTEQEKFVVQIIQALHKWGGQALAFGQSRNAISNIDDDFDGADANLSQKEHVTIEINEKEVTFKTTSAILLRSNELLLLIQSKEDAKLPFLVEEHTSFTAVIGYQGYSNINPEKTYFEIFKTKDNGDKTLLAEIQMTDDDLKKAELRAAELRLAELRNKKERIGKSLGLTESGLSELKTLIKNSTTSKNLEKPKDTDYTFEAYRFARELNNKLEQIRGRFTSSEKKAQFNDLENTIKEIFELEKNKPPANEFNLAIDSD